LAAAPKISIVIPMLNEAENIGTLFARLFPVMDALGERYEVIAIDDGSTDETPRRLSGALTQYPHLAVVTLRKNYGQHAAVMAGFEAARGEWVITLDADLQNPPEEIPKLVEAFRNGHDVVNTIRQERDDTFFRRTASRIVNELARRASGIRLNDFGCMLRGYHRDLLGPMIERKEFETFIPALAMVYACNPTEIEVGHAAREAGDSKYSLLRLFSLQLDLMMSFSLLPIRLLFLLGVGIALAGMGFGTLLLLLRVVMGPEWAVGGVFTLFAILFFFVGAQFIALGLIGEYVGRVYYEVRQRPTFMVREINRAQPNAAGTPESGDAAVPVEIGRGSGGAS
jgi:undecaprenyl-phosphate 4-deoxy-4-formamido-L-arabinose transferase